jgi:hypothetical protein
VQTNLLTNNKEMTKVQDNKHLERRRRGGGRREEGGGEEGKRGLNLPDQMPAEGRLPEHWMGEEEVVE